MITQRERQGPVTPAARYAVCQDVRFEIAFGGAIASNFRTRTHVWLNLPLFNALADSPRDGDLRAADLTRFSNVDGLLADPTCLHRDIQSAEIISFSDFTSALEFLARRFIVIRNHETYKAFLARKTSPLDRKHFGTFHQQLGVELRLKQRCDPVEWWYEQKFDRATGEVRDNLYKVVQEAFLERYFAGWDFTGKAVLDFGCGSGMASRRFAAAGARVIGVDPDERLLCEAKRRIGDRFYPVTLHLQDPDPIASLPSETVDLIWLADVFMFYFYPADGGVPPLPPAELLRRLTAHLAPTGKCVIMQPHGVFWLAPWLGDGDNPFTVITEYASRLYSVVPGLQEMCDAIAEAHLAITRVYEPTPDRPGVAVDARAVSFAHSFPQWWVFECAKLPSQ